MPGDDWQKFANLRLLLGYMYAQPGKEACSSWESEIGQWREWDHNNSLDWNLLDHDRHRACCAGWKTSTVFIRMNRRCMLDTDPAGFEWIDGSDADNSVISFLRKGAHPGEDDPDRLQLHASAAI